MWDPGPIWTGAEILVPTGIRFPDRPARSESLYRLSYPRPVSKLTVRNAIPIARVHRTDVLCAGTERHTLLGIWYCMCCSSTIQVCPRTHICQLSLLQCTQPRTKDRSDVTADQVQRKCKQDRTIQLGTSPDLFNF